MDTKVSRENKLPTHHRKRPALDKLVLDESSRPRAPRIEGVTPEQRWQGRHLAAIHRLHLQELSHVRNLLDKAETGDETPTRLAEAVSGLAMTKAYRDFGTMCGRECQLLTFHHSYEEQNMFPALAARGSAGLRAVVSRLQEEHEVVHALLERLKEDTVALMSSPARESFMTARDTFHALEKVVRSHFGYEENELEDALGYHAII